MWTWNWRIYLNLIFHLLHIKTIIHAPERTWYIILFFSFSWTSERTRSLEVSLTLGMRNILSNNSDGERAGLVLTFQRKLTAVLKILVNSVLKMQFYRTAAWIECNYGKAHCISGSTAGVSNSPFPWISTHQFQNFNTRCSRWKSQI